MVNDGSKLPYITSFLLRRNAGTSRSSAWYVGADIRIPSSEMTSPCCELNAEGGAVCSNADGAGVGLENRLWLERGLAIFRSRRNRVIREIVGVIRHNGNDHDGAGR